MRSLRQALGATTFLAGLCLTAAKSPLPRRQAQFGDVPEITGTTIRGINSEAVKQTKSFVVSHECTKFNTSAGEFPPFRPNEFDTQLVYDDRSGFQLHVACYRDVESNFPFPIGYVLAEYPTNGQWFRTARSGPKYVAKTTPVGRDRSSLFERNFGDFNLNNQPFQDTDQFVTKLDGSVTYTLDFAKQFMTANTEGLHAKTGNMLFVLNMDVIKGKPSIYTGPNATFALVSDITYFSPF